MNSGTWSDIPQNKKLMMAACDSEYFKTHAIAFVYSCFNKGLDCHIDIVNATEEVKVDAAKLCQSHTNFTWSHTHKDMVNFSKEERRVYYSCHRFFVAQKWLEVFSESSLCIVDIDCYVNNDFNPFELDVSIGLFLRPSLPGTFGWEEHGTHVAAGIVLLNSVNDMDKTHKEFIDRVIDKINIYGLKWFVDQVALWEVYNDMQLDSNNQSSFFQFTENHLDWEFKEDTFLWTGKGDRKNSNETYVNKKKDLELQFKETC